MVHNWLQRVAAKQLSQPKNYQQCPFPFVPPLSLHPPSDLSIPFSYFLLPLFNPLPCSSSPSFHLLSLSLGLPNSHPAATILGTLTHVAPSTWRATLPPHPPAAHRSFSSYNKTSKTIPTWQLLTLLWSLTLMTPYLFPVHPGTHLTQQPSPHTSTVHYLSASTT